MDVFGIKANLGEIPDLFNVFYRWKSKLALEILVIISEHDKQFFVSLFL
jgi:hypothetical protein